MPILIISRRGNRFDVVLNNFMNNNNYNFVSDSHNFNQFSYKKGEYKACIDHCIIRDNYNNNENIKLYSKLLNDEENLSDHKPLEIIINFYVDDNNLKTLTNNVEPKLYIKLPNLENNEIKKKFNDLLFINFYSNGLPIEDINNKQDYFDKMYNHITKSISIALNSCTQTIIQIKQQMMLI